MVLRFNTQLYLKVLTRVLFTTAAFIEAIIYKH
jgi:hypothetical protein